MMEAIGVESLVVPVQVKKTNNYTIRIPDDEHALHVQLYFTDYNKLIANRVFFEIKNAIITALEESDYTEEFEVTFIAPEKSLYIGCETFFDNLANSLEKIVSLIEEQLIKYLD